MNRDHITRLLLIASILYVVGFYFIGAAIKPGYSQLSNFVSEYNATGTPWATTLTYAGFFAVAALLSCFLISAAPITKVSGVSRAGFWLLWSIPFSYFVAAIVPCDAGCPAEGSMSQLLHNALSILAYFGMGISIAMVALDSGFNSYKLRRTFMILTGMAFPVIFIAMLQPELASWKGLLQRSLDVAMAGSLFLMIHTLTTTTRKTTQA